MIELFEIKGGWGYKVEGVYQEYDPDCEGFVTMTKERAEICANLVFERLKN
jgi:hypothetical protein